MSWAGRLAEGEPIDEPVAVVVAHADDETLWCGSALPRLRNCRLIHLTDSAPRDGGAPAPLAFAPPAELERALAELGASPERIGYGVPDKEAVDHLPELAERLLADCEGMAAIVTHPYEGGHPDHDAAALAARVVADRLGRPLVEFACYPEIDGERAFGRLWPDAERPEHVRSLPPPERDALARALAAHATQAGVIDGYLPDAERWRDAPRYDFTRPPPPGRALYDRFGWAMTSARWRDRARSLLGVPA